MLREVEAKGEEAGDVDRGVEERRRDEVVSLIEEGDLELASACLRKEVGSMIHGCRWSRIRGDAMKSCPMGEGSS